MNFPSLVRWDQGHTAAEKLGHSHAWQVDRWTGGPGAFTSHLAFPGLPWIPLCAGIHMTLSFSLSPLPHLRLPAPGRASSCCCALINNTENARTHAVFVLARSGEPARAPRALGNPEERWAWLPEQPLPALCPRKHVSDLVSASPAGATAPMWWGGSLGLGEWWPPRPRQAFLATGHLSFS